MMNYILTHRWTHIGLRVALLCVFLLFSPAVLAEPYFGKSFTYQQPDGENFKIRLWGDEFFAYQETEDGYLVVRDPATGFFCYAKVLPNGSDIVSTGVRVGGPKPAGLVPKQRLARGKAFEKSLARRELLGADERGRRRLANMKAAEQGKAAVKSPIPDPDTANTTTEELPMPLPAPAPGDSGSGTWDLPPPQPAPPSTPTVNTRVGLVLLASFPDAQGEISKTPAQINSYFNDLNYTVDGNATSIRGYFLIESNGKLVYTNIVTAWFVAANNKAYYTDTAASYGSRARELVAEGLSILESNGFDFTLCDANGDGQLDGVNLFYAGAAVNGWGEGLWPHSSGLTWEPILTNGLSNSSMPYQITDLPASLGIGTVCHENGHMICDFPDLYSYDGNAADIGEFSMYGSFHPTHIDPYLRMHAGWITVTDVELSGQTSYSLAVDGTNVIRYVNPNDPAEYFLFEMRGNVGYEGPYGGSPTTVCPSRGLVVYHAMEYGQNTRSSIYTADSPNCDYTTPYELLVLEDNPQTRVYPWYDDPAPDVEDAFDTADEVNDSTTPSLSFWGSSGRSIASGICIGNIQVGTSNLTFSIYNSNPPVITATPRMVQAGSNTTLSVAATGIVSYAWSKVSGPGGVAFGSSNAAVTTATFGPTIGTYVLRVTMLDGSPDPIVSEISIRVIGGLSEYVGHYKSFPVASNDWLVGWIEFGGSPLKWRNQAAASWNITNTADPDVFLTVAEWPYGANKEFAFKRENGQVVLFAFNNGIYTRCTPVADNIVTSTTINTAIGILLTASDAEDEPITSYNVISAPSHGALSGSPPNLTYTPNTNYTGGDCFTFKASDGTYTSNVATVTIDVNVLPVVDAGTNQTLMLTADAGSRSPRAGAYYEWDAAKDKDSDSTWESTTGQTYNWTMEAGAQSPVAVTDTLLNVTNAYVFPTAKSQSQTTLQNSVNENSSATWEFVLDTDADDGLIMESGNTTSGVQFWIAAGALKGQVRDNGKNATVSHALTAQDKAGFLHIVYVIDMIADTFKLYVNGVEVDSVPWTGSDWCGSDNAGLGRVGGTAPAGSVADFTGKMALVRFYEDRALSAEDVHINTASLFRKVAVANLDGTVSDGDGDGIVTTWSLASTEPAGMFVSFGDDSLVDTTATFLRAGTYTLRLTANDGSAQTNDDVVISVSDLYTLTYLAGANGSISGTATQIVNYGSGGTEVTAIPDPGCHFVDWSDNSTDNPRMDTNVTQDITVTAYFATNAPPAVDLSPGAVSMSETSTMIQGLLTAGNPADIWICWGAGDGGTTSTGDWDNIVSLGTLNDSGSFSNLVSGFSTNRTYFYRCYAENPYGTAWTPADTFNGSPAGGGGAWTPADTNVSLWLDADDASMVLLNGSTVSNWVDKSGSGRNATQTTVASQPTDTAGGLNGKHVLTFDGTNDFFNVDLNFLAGVSHSAFVVTKPTNYNNIYGAANGNAGSNSLHVGFSNSSTYRMNYWANDWNKAMTTNFHAGQANLVNYVWTSGANKQIFANGVSEGTAGSAGVIGTMAGGGRIVNIVGQGYFGGAIAEIIMVTGTVSQVDREIFEGYLAHKWGVEAFLPTNHTYKSTAPGGGGAIVVNLAPTAITNNQANLNGSLNVSGTNYDVYVHYGTSDGATNGGIWDTSASLGSCNVSTNVSYNASLNPGTAYYYAFQASNAVTNVWASPSWRFATPGVNSSVAKPTGLLATAVSTSQVNLVWTDNATNETGFLVERSLTSGAGFTGLISRAANSTNYSDNAVTPGLAYYYRITATNATTSSAASAEASATVPKITASVTLTNLAQVYSGTARTVGSTTIPAGLTVVVTYNGNTYAPTNAGTYSVTGMVNEVSYQGWTNGTLVVSKATPAVSPWPTATSIEAGQALSNSVLSGGSAGAVDGSFSFQNPAATPPLGTNSVNVVFTPTNVLNYNMVTGQVDVVVTAALIHETVTLSATNQVYDGTARAVTVTTTPDAGLTVSVTYDGNAWAPTNVGSYAVVATVTQPGYSGSTNGTLVVTKGTPTGITWPTTTNSILLGQAISDAPLYGGSASVSGSFSYNVPGTVPGVGVYAADVTFTPNDAANYNTVGGTVDVTVDAPALIINNSTGAVAIAETVASLSGEVASGGPATAWICWGLTDAGTVNTGDWANVVMIGSVSDGVPFSTNVTGLSSNTTYFYRCYATNAYGDYAWSSEAEAFSGNPVGGGDPWTPYAIWPKAWFDASDAGSLTVTNVSGTNYVMKWSDLSGNSNHATQVTEARRPVMGTNQINNLNVLTFEAPAANNGKALGFSLTPFGNAHGVFFVAREDVGGNYISVLRLSMSGNQMQIGATGDNYMSIYNNGSWGSTDFNAPTGSSLAAFMGASIGNGDGTATPYYNGNVQNTESNVPSSFGSITAIIGNNNISGTSGAWDGDIAEIIVCTNAVDTTNRQLIEGYLANKWGLASSLPTNHPYKSSGPGTTGPIANLAPANLAATSADFNASVNAAGTNYDVYVYWGTNNGGTNASSWASTNSAGSVTDMSTNVSYSASNLVAGQTYYYAFMASNSSGTVWASPSWCFATPGIAQTCQLTVESAYGSPFPVVGVTYPYSNSVVNAWISGTSITNDLTNYVCTGWIGSGSAPASGTGTNMSFTITNNTTITWQWSTNYWVELGVMGE